jgi:hypothetical protein
MEENVGLTGEIIKSETSFAASAPFNWRAHLAVHPAAELFPLMGELELKELAKDIEAHGLQTPIVIWAPTGELLDGRNRLDALALLGLLCTRNGDDLRLSKSWSDEAGCWVATKKPNTCGWNYLDSGNPYAIALSFNVHRRHLTAEKKHDLIREVLKAKPELSDRQVGKMVGADKNTVAGDRADLEARGEIHHVEKRKDSKGRKQPAKKPKAPKTPKIPGSETQAPKVATKRAAAGGMDPALFADSPQPTQTSFLARIGVKTVLAALPLEWLEDVRAWVAAHDAPAPAAPASSPDDHPDTPGFPRREASTPDAPVPMAPPALAPTSPVPELKVLSHYVPTHKDPWPTDWRHLDAVALEEAIGAVQRFGVNHRLEERHHRQLARMRERLDDLRLEIPTSLLRGPPRLLN